MIEDYEIFCRDSQRVPEGMVFFGTADNNYAKLLANGRDASDNAVYLWEMAADDWGTGDNRAGLVRVADTLPQFICGTRHRDMRG
jgi:hypothetical protein